MPTPYYVNMAAPLQIQLTPEEDRLLLELSLDRRPTRKPASGPPWSAWPPRAGPPQESPATSTKRPLHRLPRPQRFLEQGLPGLAYRKPPGAPRKFTPQMAAFLEERLAEDEPGQPRQLAKPWPSASGSRLAPKVISRHLRAMGHVEADAVRAFGKTHGGGDEGLCGGGRGGKKGAREGGWRWDTWTRAGFP